MIGNKKDFACFEFEILKSVLIYRQREESHLF